MRKKLLLTAFALLAAAPAHGSGFRIPEQSLRAVALANAYGAAPAGADASYYNPAAMSWLGEGWQTEASATWIHLASISYEDANSAARSSGSRSEDFLLPNLHLVSPEVTRFRLGFSAIYPFGLSKRWDGGLGRQYAEDFTLKTYEFNPTVSYRLADRLAIGAGLRVIHATGEVRSLGTLPAPVSLVARRDMEGDTTELGYNLALSWKPVAELALAATYRSQIDLDMEGDARLYLNGPLAPPNGTGGFPLTYNGYAEVKVATPDVLTLAGSYTWCRTTFEVNWDRTFWSAYDQLDFNYDATLNPAFASFDRPLRKDWSDTDALRIGVSHRLNDVWTLMAGFALDENPVPDATLGFELPDSDAKIYSLGLAWQPTERLTLGAAYLFDDKESRSVAGASPTSMNPAGITGTFADAAAHLVTIGGAYRF
ncbi:MAG: outer membrane protein transport protein [Thermodesulfobacteriota bacterium]